jgi:hypothetical protein
LCFLVLDLHHTTEKNLPSSPSTTSLFCIADVQRTPEVGLAIGSAGLIAGTEAEGSLCEGANERRIANYCTVDVESCRSQ